MAVIIEWNDDEWAAWNAWVQARPPVIRALATRWPPTHLYRMGETGHRCTIYSYAEDGTVTVEVTGEYNRVLFGRHVFGVNPHDLMECELPGVDEDVGDTSREAGYSAEDVTNILIPKLREQRGH